MPLMHLNPDPDHVPVSVFNALVDVVNELIDTVGKLIEAHDIDTEPLGYSEDKIR